MKVSNENSIDFNALAGRFMKPAEVMVEQEIKVVDVKEGEISKLRFFPDDVGCMPTILTRTALFGVRGGGSAQREFHRDKELPSIQNISIRFTGEDLTDLDGDVFLYCLTRLRGLAFDTSVKLSPVQVLNALSRVDNGDNRKLIVDSLERLSQSLINVKCMFAGKRLEVSTSLLSYSRAEDNFSVGISIHAQALFDNVSFQSLLKRFALSSSLSKTLLDYVSSHKIGIKHSQRIDIIRDLARSNRRLDLFKKSLKSSLAELCENGIISDIEITNETISFIPLKQN